MGRPKTIVTYADIRQHLTQNEMFEYDYYHGILMLAEAISVKHYDRFKELEALVRSRMNVPHYVNQRVHSKTRAKERYAVNMTDQDIDNIIKKIQSNDAQFLGRNSMKTSVWKVIYQGRIFKVVYDRNKKNLATFLPLNGKGF